MPDKPNILFIMTDQQRYDCVGANGNAPIRTPHLDALAGDSANFRNAFAQAPVCVPSRVTTFTGRYPHSHRNRVNNTPLKSDEVLLPQYLRESGYRTAVVGKVHLYPPTPERVEEAGFDTVFLHDGLPKNDPYSAYVEWRKANDPNGQVHYKALAENLSAGDNPYRSALPEEFTETAWVGMQTRKTLCELASQGRPFFLFSSFFKPHEPFEVPAPFDSMYNDVEIPLPRRVGEEEIRLLPKPLQILTLRDGPNRDAYPQDLQWIYRSYYGTVTHIDREVGRILETLEETGLAGETIVLFMSDHGDQLCEHGIKGKNAFFEASVHVPLMLRFPKVVRAGNYEELVEATDILPTLFGFLGMEEPYHCQGRSFAPLISDIGGPYQERDAVFCENIIPEVITEGNWKFPFEKGKGVGGILHPDAKMVRTRKWKLNYYPGHGGELYDLEKDPTENRNLFHESECAGIVQELEKKLLDWMIATDETEQIAEKWLF